MNKEIVFKKKNPCNMWKEHKEIIIKFPNLDENIQIQKFTCLIDERKDKYFYSEEADYGYHSRLFNKQMLVGTEQIIYSADEMKNIAVNKYLNARKQMNKALEVIEQTQESLKENKLLELGE